MSAICQTAVDLVNDAGMGSMVIAERLDPIGIAVFIYMVPHIILHLDLSLKEKNGKAAIGCQLTSLRSGSTFVSDHE